jgi:hypothetical protein
MACFDRKTATIVQGIGTVDRKGDAGVGAVGGLRFFVHGDAIAMEMTPPFRLRKEDVPDIDRKPFGSLWFPRNHR